MEDEVIKQLDTKFLIINFYQFWKMKMKNIIETIEFSYNILYTFKNELS